ncbi:MAG: tRNA threonylcarbamoyladenosine dehydratase, partial [Clostridia bacterium]|nr:tRNA threonylcarbamoyladenosine dehydratase [Clostridia bacterium]
ITDINKTSVCPLAKVMRRELKKMGVPKLTVLYSKEEPKKAPPIIDENGVEKRAQTGSLPYVPSVAGLVIASYVVKELLK